MKENSKSRSVSTLERDDIIGRFIVDVKTQLGLINACFARIEENMSDFKRATILTDLNESKNPWVTGRLESGVIIDDELFDNICQVVANLSTDAKNIFNDNFVEMTADRLG